MEPEGGLYLAFIVPSVSPSLTFRLPSQITLIAVVLGLVACLSSLIFLVIVMQGRNGNFISKVCARETGFLKCQHCHDSSIDFLCVFVHTCVSNAPRVPISGMMLPPFAICVACIALLARI